MDNTCACATPLPLTSAETGSDDPQLPAAKPQPVCRRQDPSTTTRGGVRRWEVSAPVVLSTQPAKVADGIKSFHNHPHLMFGHWCLSFHRDLLEMVSSTLERFVLNFWRPVHFIGRKGLRKRHWHHRHQELCWYM